MSTAQLFGAAGAKAITPSDSANFATTNGNPSRGLLVKTTGDYKLTMEDGSEVTMYLMAGVVHPIRCKRVWSTGAASTSGIVAFY